MTKPRMSTPPLQQGVGMYVWDDTLGEWVAWDGNGGTMSYELGIAATGTTQGTAKQLTKNFNSVSTADGSNDGVRLSASMANGSEITVSNIANTSINVYPPSGGTLDKLNANDSHQLNAVRTITYVKVSDTQWYTKATATIETIAP